MKNIQISRPRAYLQHRPAGDPAALLYYSGLDPISSTPLSPDQSNALGYSRSSTTTASWSLAYRRPSRPNRSRSSLPSSGSLPR